MGLIKKTPADNAFSDCVRERAGWCCERCGTYYPEGRRGGLHCSHFHGRGNWGIRFDPLNAFSHCFGCHQKLGANPHEFREWVVEKIGEGAYEILLERKNDTGLGKMVRRTKGKGEIAKHYRDQLKAMRELRERGISELEFEGWAWADGGYSSDWF